MPRIISAMMIAHPIAIKKNPGPAVRVAIKAMAMTTYDLLADPSLVKRARAEFEASA